MHIYADWEITWVLSKMHKSGAARGTSLQLRAHPPARRGMLVATRHKEQEKPKPELNLICTLRGSRSTSQIQGNSHKIQVIYCNIVAGSCSQFAELGEVLGVPGLPQSTAGRGYEIFIYIYYYSLARKVKIEGQS